MAINLNDNVFSASPKLLDAKWGPFPDLASAYAAVLPSFRKIGMFAIISPPAGSAQLYWYKNDTTTLVPFSGNSSVQVYPTYNDFPGTGLVDVIYIDKSNSLSYYWNTSLNPADYTLSGTTVEVYPSLTGSNPGTDSFPTTGVENVIYVASDTDISYIWNPTLLNGNGDYEILIGTAVKERVTYHECNSGIADTYVVSTAAITTNTIGDAYLIKFDVANTGPSTLQLGTGPVASLYNTKTGTTLEAGDLEAGVVHLVVFTSKSPSIFEVLTIGGGGTADTGNIGFENNWIKNTVGEDIYISPQDGYTWLWLPSDTNAAAGDYINLGSTHPDGDGVYINTNAGSWHFKNDGILQVPGRISFGGLDWQSIGVGNVSDHGGAYGISLYCTIGYELNWQAGYLAARDPYSPYNLRPIYSDSLIKYATPGDYPTFHATFDDDTLINKKYLEDKDYSGIVTADITNWNTAYGWGDHASAGYLTDAAGSISNDGKTYGRKDGAWSEVVSTGGMPHATASGTDTYTVTITGVTAYNDGDAYLIRFPNGNTSSATLNINSIGAKTLYRNNDGPLIGGDIFNGGEMICVYNSTSDGFQCIGSSPNSLFAYVTNGEASTISRGQVVYASGGTGDRMVVMLASNSQDSTSAKTVGVVYSTSIGANQKGIILMQGLIDGLSLPTATWSDGDSVYLGSTAGSITKTKPFAPNHLVYVATVTTASNGNGRMYVKIQNGYELDEIHDVQINSGTIATGHYLYYDSAGNGLWKNSASWQGDTIAVTKGGTGFSSYAIGDILYADTTTSLAKLAGVDVGSVLVSGGVGAAPSWSNSPELRSVRLDNATNANIITLDTGATSSSYSITFPAAPPTGNQYLQVTSGGVGTWVNGTTTGVTTVGTFSASAQTNGATISGATITFGPASATVPGMVSTGTQIFAGAKTFSSAVTVSATTNQLVLGTTNTTTITSPAPAASRVYTIPDAGTTASFVMTEGAQNIAGAKTFTGSAGPLIFSQTGAGTFTAPAVGATPSAGTRIVVAPGDVSNFANGIGWTTSYEFWMCSRNIISFYPSNSTTKAGDFRYTTGTTTVPGIKGLSLQPSAFSSTESNLDIGIGWLKFVPYGNNAGAAPSTTSRTAGTRIVLVGSGDGSATLDTALGNMQEGGGGTNFTSMWLTAARDVVFYTNSSATERFRINSTGLSYNATKVVGARVTGWTAATGTPARSTFATFTGQTISASPTQTQVQNIDNHMVILSQRVKALIDDLISHGLIGT